MVTVHELGFLSGVVGVVSDAAEGREVTAVGLAVGSRSGLVLDALDASWPLAIAGTPLAAATLELTWVPATVYCPQCAASHEIDEFFALTCPVCGTPTADLRDGRTATVSYIDVAT